MIDTGRGSEVQQALLEFQAALGDMDAFYRVHGPLTHANQPRHAAIAKHVRGPWVLDFGCGTGDLLLILQDQHEDWTLAGIDKSAVALDMARARGVTALLLHGTEPAGGPYNTVCASQVLEHVDDDALLLDQLVGCLEIPGRLIVTVPRDNRAWAPDHRRTYTEVSLQILLSKYGFVWRDDDWPGSRDRMLAIVDT